MYGVTFLDFAPIYTTAGNIVGVYVILGSGEQFGGTFVIPGFWWGTERVDLYIRNSRFWWCADRGCRGRTWVIPEMVGCGSLGSKQFTT